jgi:hypothetical protein
MSTREDLNDKGVFNPGPLKKKGLPRVPVRTYSGGEVPREDEIIIGFDASGSYTDQPDDVCCKRVQTDRSIRYYIKFCTMGTETGRMLNPVGMYFRKDQVSSSDPRTGRLRYEFRGVGEGPFRDYLKFLSTKNESYLRSAERQVLDA